MTRVMGNNKGPRASRSAQLVALIPIKDAESAVKDKQCQDLRFIDWKLLICYTMENN